MQYNSPEKKHRNQLVLAEDATTKPINNTSLPPEHRQQYKKEVKSATTIPFKSRSTSLNSHRSLSSCPTYSSLSRHSPETRDCATQITTLPRTSSSEEHYFRDRMPISSGFGYYPYNYPTTRTERIPLERTTSERWQVPPRRPPEIRRPNANGSPRSDTSLTRSNGMNGAPRANDQNQPPAASQRRQPPPDDRRFDPGRNGEATRSFRHSDPSIGSNGNARKPLRLAPIDSNPSGQRPAPLSPRDPSNAPREVIIERRRRPLPPAQPAPVYVYDDYAEGTTVETDHSPRVVRVVRDRPIREADDVYYVEAEPERIVYETQPVRQVLVQRPPATEYVYVDEAPSTRVVRRERLAMPREKVVYVDEPQIIETRRPAQVEYVDEYVYLDENGNEVEVIRDQNRSSSKTVQYVYEDELDRRGAKSTKVVYVNGDGKISKKSKKSSNN